MKNSPCILFGNGLNYFSEGFISWTDLLKQIAESSDKYYDGDTFNPIPNTILYELLLPTVHSKPVSFTHGVEHISFQLKTEEIVKNRIADFMYGIESNDWYERLSRLNVENYLTTNYDYALLKTFKGMEKNSNNTEKIYSIRRNTAIMNGDKVLARIWPIHGAAYDPKTIMLGLDHYSGYIEKIGSFIKGKYKGGPADLKERLINREPLCGKYWIDNFFFNDVHIIGFGLDYCEIDLWRILNKRARLIKEMEDRVTNKIYFYCDELPEDKKVVFKDFGIIPVEMHEKGKEKNWEDIWERTFDLLEERIGIRK